jgi:ribosomal protein S18 acetylase RimI-like enzyme
MIETATTDDFNAIAELNVAAFAEFAPHLEAGPWQDMQKNLRNVAERARKAVFLVCRVGNEIAGSVGYCPAGKGDDAIFSPDMASVLLLAVHPRHRGKGLAKALTAACIARARDEGATCIALFTSELMQPAHHIYRSLGFRLESELPARYGIRYFRFVLPLA